MVICRELYLLASAFIRLEENGELIDLVEEGGLNEARNIRCFLEESLPQVVEDERCIHRVGLIRCEVRTAH